MKKLLVGLAAAASVFAFTPAADARTGTQALQDAHYYGVNNCPRPGGSAWYRCLDSAVMENMVGIGGGRWTTRVAVWECYKVDPFCKNHQSARRGGDIDIRVNNDGSVVATSGWHNY